MADWVEWNKFDGQTYYQTSDIPRVNTSECDENNSPNESTYFIDETSTFETDMVFNLREDLINWVQNVGRTIGYVIVIKNSRRNYNVVFQCDRGGLYRSTKISTRNTGTKKINCPFKLEGRYNAPNDFWKLNMVCEMHNHHPALYLEGHPYPRRLTEEETRLVEDLLEKNVKPKDILSTLKKQNVNNLSTIKTIYNADEKLRRTKRRGKSQMQIVMEFLHHNGFVYESRANASTNELEDLFFAHPKSMEVLRAFPHVLLMDATYSTNKYKMPLLEIVGVTPTNLTFCVAFVYMHKERTPNYTWALDCLKSVIDGCMFPRVIVTDRELALMNAYNIVFPNAKGLLCRWHINHSIMNKCRSSWDIIYPIWTRLVASTTEGAFTITLAELEKQLAYYPDALLYLNTTWLTPYKEMFVSAWTDKYLNFGNHTSNRVESQHAKTKRYLDTSQFDIAKSLKRIDVVVNSQYLAITASIENNLITSRHRFNFTEELKIHFRHLCLSVSIYALEIIFKEYERSKYVGPFIDNCGCHVRACYGLPCAHEQAVFSNNAHSLPLDLVDPFWKKLNLSPCTPLADEDTRYEVLLERFNEKFKAQSRSGKLSLMKKFQNIISPSTSVGEPAVQKNTRGRPSLKNKLFRKKNIDLNQNLPAKDPPTQDPPNEYPHRRSISTYTPDYMRSNLFDLNQEPDRHSSCVNHEQPMYYSHPLMNEISVEFQPYVSNIVNVDGDGNCGFRAIAVALGYNENYWPQIRKDLSNELLAHPIEYAMLYEDDLNNLSDSLNFYGSRNAPRKHWLIMPPTGFLIANRYNRIVHFISKQGSSTIFPLWHGPQDIPTHDSVVLAHVQGAHYVNVDLQGAYPFPTIWYLWHQHKSLRSAGWEAFYAARINAYIPPHERRNNFNFPPTVISADS